MKTKLIILFLLFSFVGLTAQDKGKFIELKKQPQLTHQVLPAYPEEAKKLGVTGKLVLEMNIDAVGNVTGATVVTANHQGPDGMVIDEATKLKLKNVFDQPAIDAALKMKFSPGIDKNNNPVKCTVMQPFYFKLGDKKK
jgi:outer membrane biosynthesis protein TonB